MSFSHKLRNSAAIYLDEIKYNHAFCCPTLYKMCKFIYLIREARPSLNAILHTGYNPQSGFFYYTYRLRRLYEMAKKTPGAVFLTWENVASGKGLELIEEHLNLKDPLKIEDFEGVDTPDVIDLKLVERAQARYEKYFYLFKNMNLKCV
jgi:hypothetical protein